nr:DAR GTPase 2, mitochondrial-like [Quercus suber]
MAATAILARQIGALATKGGGGWYGPHMAAASRAIAERLPLVDLVLEIRDARIPLSSEYEQLRNYPSSSRRIIVMNKMDLANRSQIKIPLSSEYEQLRNYPSSSRRIIVMNKMDLANRSQIKRKTLIHCMGWEARLTTP